MRAMCLQGAGQRRSGPPGRSAACECSGHAPWPGLGSRSWPHAAAQQPLPGLPAAWPTPTPAPTLRPAQQIVREAYPDHTQFDPASEYYDARASRDSPTWVMVDCRLVSGRTGCPCRCWTGAAVLRCAGGLANSQLG